MHIALGSHTKHVPATPATLAKVATDPHLKTDMHDVATSSDYTALLKQLSQKPRPFIVAVISPKG